MKHFIEKNLKSFNLYNAEVNHVNIEFYISKTICLYVEDLSDYVKHK